MPLKSGSSDKVVQDNIKAILAHDGSAGYDPPYMDPARDKYTPEQAAAIAYAKAGRRNNAGGYKGKPDKTYKAPKNDKLQDGQNKWWREGGVKVPGVKPKDAEPETDSEREAKKPDKDLMLPKKRDQKLPEPKVPEGWKVKDQNQDQNAKPEGKKPIKAKPDPNLKPKKPPEKITPEEDKKMLDEVLAGYKIRWGLSNEPTLIRDTWEDLNDKEKRDYHKQALKYLKNNKKEPAPIKDKQLSLPMQKDGDKQLSLPLPKEGEGPDIQVPEGWKVKGQDQGQGQGQGQPSPMKITDQFGFRIPEGIADFDLKKEWNDPNAKLIGDGAMGDVKLNADETICIKEGKIGENEAYIIKKMEGSGVTPMLYKALITGKAKTVKPSLGAHVKEAKGYLAMENAKGKTFASLVKGGIAGKELMQVSNEYFRCRMILHTSGVAHNDLHGANFFFDTKTGKGMAIDFGLAQDSHRAALIEALATFNGRDFQAERMMRRLEYTNEITQLKDNIAKVHEEIKAKHGKYVRADIRSAELDWATHGMSEEEAKSYVEKIYKGVFS